TSDATSRARQISDRIAQPRPMRRGSLSERYVKCSKPGCPCAERAEARHGPYFSWTRKIGGRTHSRFLTPEQAALVRRQIEAGHAFRNDIEALWEVCEQWADSELRGGEIEPTEEAEKGGSKHSSKRRSPPKSRPS
ncbi:MAG TPA: DUF6788 family protein, partial [Thermoanaerobaculia bacterium]|nr:DUF6788 family protein [Thermoanaerobaculia bacterium]